ncbi:hypothetical protein WQQ_13280 [Hydrocarboniphaga effusa AP103]|uniref:Uncharacterized protein n=1 Tax=Hydrocarboniphaga effusa AP103 TaxID=1172194 RepID=I8I4L3_9GAMM|nr:hypothetical protein WQQ_13280 [Hydrocarboniphaga effusa AP103]
MDGLSRKQRGLFSPSRYSGSFNLRLVKPTRLGSACQSAPFYWPACLAAGNSHRVAMRSTKNTLLRRMSGLNPERGTSGLFAQCRSSECNWSKV